MKVKLTIRTMVRILVVTGLLVVALLAAVSIYSNNELLKSQARLTDTVIPLETANRNIRLAMARFIERQGRIIGTDKKTEIEALQNRSGLETAFTVSLDQIRTLLSAHGDMKAEIQNLSNAFQGRFLVKDAEIIEARKNALELTARIREQVERLDKIGNQLQASAERMSGQINFEVRKEKIAMRQYMASEDRSREMRQAVAELLEGDLTLTQQACNNLRIAVTSLVSQGSRLLTSDLETINDIRSGAVAESGRQVKKALDDLEGGLKSASDLLKKVDDIRNSFTRLLGVLNEVGASREMLLAKKRRMAEIRNSLGSIRDELNAKLDELLTAAETIRNSVQRQARKQAEMSTWLVIGVGLVSALIMVAGGMLMPRRIIAPVQRALGMVNAIAECDFTVGITEEDYHREDEIGQLISRLREMAASLSTLIGQVQRSGMQVTSSATELAATAKQQEATVSGQAESTGNVVRAVGEISRIAGELVQTMQQVAAMSGETAKYAARGQNDLTRMSEAIHQMEDASKSVSEKLEAINEKAANITSVVTTITKVADQTNLLSLNAAIEAEKAGESGRGFTVVAREIRRLADQTSVATLDIEKMVQGMQTAVSAGVMEMETFIKEVRNSSEDVGRISRQLKRIIKQVQALSPSFDNVTDSMEQQAENARGIDGAMSELNKNMQQTMASLKESFQAIEQLNEAAGILQDEVSRFKVNG